MESITATEKNPFMTLHSVDLRSTGQFPALLLDYLDQKPGLESFYDVYPTIENAEKIIRKRAAFGNEKRKTLVSVLEKQYKGIASPPDFSMLLDEKTFTVTTGHQLNIFTGPLYIIYKIVTTIKLARSLQDAYPDCRFIPVYWMATEDHDFEEIASFHLFGETHTWRGQHTGAVGRLDPKELKNILPHLPEKPDLFSRAYLENDTLTDAVRCYMHELFGNEGLICLDADNEALKRQFLPIIREELVSHQSADLVADTSSRLAALGYHTPLNAREINLFYLEGNLRERIVRDGEYFKVLNSELSFSEEEILALAENHPEFFSPNVVLRPLYEETILPNLAYIGGPSEVPYWMQLRDMFAHYEVTFPMLIPRNFALYITSLPNKKIKKLGLEVRDLFLDEVTLRRSYVAGHSANTLDLNDEKDTFNRMFDSVTQKAAAIDPTMESAVRAEQTRILHLLDHLENRLKKAEERNYASEIEQLLALKNKLFPKGTAQERYDNFLSFYASDASFIQKLFDAFEPLDFRYNVLVES